MRIYDKDKLILEYLTIIQKQDKEIEKLTVENEALTKRLDNALTSKVNYRRAALDWKEAYEKLNEEFLEANKIVCDLVNRPTHEVERIIRAYKENM